MTGTATRRSAILMVMVAATLFAAAAIVFARAQNIWIDESTQLSGATLPPGRLLAWLAGAPEPSFGVPADRMPPISYLIDAMCSHTLCREPFDFRLVHLAIAVVGVVVVIGVAVRCFGLVAAAVTGAVLVFSPKLVGTAVELRAYPLFFTITAVQLWQLCRLVAAERLRAGQLALFGALGLLAIYTHFFGLVSTMALLCGLAAARAATKHDALAIITTAAAVLLLSAGLAPFVGGARQASDVTMTTVGPAAMAVWLPRLTSDASLLLTPVVVAAFFGALALLMLLLLVRLGQDFAREGLPARRSPATALLVALIAGLGVTLLSTRAIHGFDPLKPTYSIWTFPIIALLAGAACAPPPSRMAIVGRLVAVVFAVAALWGQIVFLSHAEWFIHGPARLIQSTVGPTASNTAVVYEGEWAYGYFPTYYLYRDYLPQWLIAPDGSLHALIRGGGVDPRAAPAAVLSRYRRIVLVDIKLAHYTMLRQLYAAGDKAAPIAAPDKRPAVDPILSGFAPARRLVAPGLYWTDVTVLGRKARN